MRTRLGLLALLPILALLTTQSPGADAPPTVEGVDFFEKKVRPVLVDHCYSCHSAAAKKAKGGLLVDSRDALRKGGDSGPGLVPGKPEESRIIKAMRHDGDPRMPPKTKLPDAVIADLEAWVKMGAPDPRDKATTTTTTSWDEILRTRRDWWSLRPVKIPEVPAVTDAAWSDQPIDRFIRARWEQAGLTPAESADRRTLLRRVSLVLTGLPPTPEEMEAYLKDETPQAYERQVDRLLDAPQFGERWARHWMDVVRFSETHGNEWNYEVHHAWRYRDYLIRAFNADVPYDQFIREHIAGDLLPRPRVNPKERINESVIGTAFYRFGEVNHDDCIEFRQIGFDVVDNQLDTLTKAFQAATVACARCHDHKRDAVSMKDYYALLGILRSSRMVSQTIDTPEVNADPIRRLKEVKAALRKELAEQWQREARDAGRYLLAAEAARAKQADADERAKGLDAKKLAAWVASLKVENLGMDDPVAPWLALTNDTAKGTEFSTAWKQLAERYTSEDRQRTEVNQKQIINFGNFQGGDFGDWRASGQGLRDGLTRSGDFVVAVEGDAAVKSILPAGCFTNSISDRLNGALRSPVLPAGKRHISFQVMGERRGAVRLVSNNCQLNYKNYRALPGDGLQWVTFSAPEERAVLRTYAELMTAFDNPKFPDQLSALGGDPTNYKMPWEKAAANPRAYFGVTRAILHDGEAPKPELSSLRGLWVGKAPATAADVSIRYATAAEAAVSAWARDQATDDDVRWLDWLLRRNLLTNSAQQSPRVTELLAHYRAAERDLELPRIVPGVGDFDGGFDQTTFVRGDCLKPVEVVPRRFLEVLAGSGGRFTPRGSGRLDLAERIATTDNPLTARVMVNRVWHHLFGAGLVRTVDDFGHMGEQPSHPELLDYLATRFAADGWSVKRLIRAIVLTRTFRLASRPVPGSQEAEPLNRLLHHYPARRLEAEAIRDSILAASGRLDRTLFGVSIQPYRDKEYADRRLFPGPLDGNGRRSIYIKVNLMEGPKFQSAFDLPNGKVSQGRRDVTNVPAQALALLNDPFVLQQADVWSERLIAREDASVAARIDHMFQVAFTRPATKDERDRFEKAVRLFAKLHEVPENEELRSRPVWKDVAHALFNVKEFIYVP